MGYIQADVSGVVKGCTDGALRKTSWTNSEATSYVARINCNRSKSFKLRGRELVKGDILYNASGALISASLRMPPELILELVLALVLRKSCSFYRSRFLGCAGQPSVVSG